MIIAALCVLPEVLNAETQERASRYRACVILAPVGIPIGGYPVSRVAFSLGKNGHWITLAGSWVRKKTSASSFFTGVVTERRSENLRDVQLLYGRRLVRGKAGHIMVSTGIARVFCKITGEDRVPTGDWPPEYVMVPIKEERLSFWGIPIAVQAILKVVEGFGVGSDLFININDDHTFAGISVCLHIGL
jgi:hypothetical protein